MHPNTSGTRRTGFQLMWHRRVGLTSFACLLVGTAWLSSVVLPGLQRTNDKQNTQTSAGGIGTMNVLSLFGNKPAPEAPTLDASLSSGAPAIGTAEISVINAPVGSALQLLLASARFSCSADPTVKGVVTYSSVGTPKPFWELLGRVIGASPAPGVHVAAVWDSYRVLPRDMKFNRMRDYPPPTVPAPIPVPLSEGRVTHRMVGYVSLTPSNAQPTVKAALLETRIPGVPAQWRMIRIGDSFLRDSPANVFNESDTGGVTKSTVRVTDLTVDHVTMSDDGNKSLKVPLSASGVADVFGFSAVVSETDRDNSYNSGRDPRSANGRKQ